MTDHSSRLGKRVARPTKRNAALLSEPIKVRFWPPNKTNTLELVGLGGCCALAVALYVRILRCAFVYDDHFQVVENIQTQSWDYLPRLLTTDVWSQRGGQHVGVYYRPLFSLWLLLVHSIGGLTPWFWHLCSVLLHVVATYVVFRLSLLLFGSKEVALFAGILFAIHPIHVEAVSWISASEEILYTDFFVMSFLLFARGLASNAKRSPTFWPSLFLWLAALLSKETAVALLPIFPLWAFAIDKGEGDSKRRARKALRTTVPFLLAAGAYLIVRSIVLGSFGFGSGRHSWFSVLLTGLSLVPFYMGKLIYPTHLSPFYEHASLSALNSSVFLGGAILLVYIGVLFMALGQRREMVVAVVCLLTLPLIPVLAGLRIFRDGDLVHDRYLYLPSVAICLIVGAVLKFFWAKSKPIKIAVATAFAAICVASCWLSASQQAFYCNDESFFKRALAIGPKNSLVMTALGASYQREGKENLAIQEFERAHDTSSDDLDALYHLARALFESKRYVDAEPYLSQLVEDPRTTIGDRGIFSLSLAQTEIRLGKLPSADSVLQSMAPEYDTLKGYHQARAVLYEREGKFGDAKTEYLREYQVSGDRSSQRRASELQRAETQGTSR